MLTKDLEVATFRSSFAVSLLKTRLLDQSTAYFLSYRTCCSIV